MADVAAQILSTDLCFQPNECAGCLGLKGVSFSRCAYCLGPLETAPIVRFGCRVVERGALYSSFKDYKNVLGAAGDSARHRLRCILSGAIDEHAATLVAALGGPPSLVAVVPSTRSVFAGYSQPLAIVARGVGALSVLFTATPILRWTGIARKARQVQLDLFAVERSIHGERVLLIEDLWVGGTTTRSAMITLQSAGATCVGLAIGRSINPYFEGADKVAKALGRPRWWTLDPSGSPWRAATDR